MLHTESKYRYILKYFTTGLPDFAECHLHSAKTRQRALGKVSDGKGGFAECRTSGTRQRVLALGKAATWRDRYHLSEMHLFETSSEILWFVSSIHYHLSEML